MHKHTSNLSPPSGGRVGPHTWARKPPKWPMLHPPPLGEGSLQLQAHRVTNGPRELLRNPESAGRTPQNSWGSPRAPEVLGSLGSSLLRLSWFLLVPPGSSWLLLGPLWLLFAFQRYWIYRVQIHQIESKHVFLNRYMF